MSNVYILGAGASKGSFPGDLAPLAKDFGEYLNKSRRYNWRKRWEFLAAAVNFLQPLTEHTTNRSWALDEIWGAIDNRYKFRKILGELLPGAPFPSNNPGKIYNKIMSPWIFAGYELKLAVNKVYGYDLIEPMKKVKKGNGTLKTEFKSLQKGDCIVSFNYDILAEEIIKSCGYKIYKPNPYDDYRRNIPGIILCKPHGSLDWKMALEKNGNIEFLKKPEKHYDYDPVEDITYQPAIIAPVPYKDELIFQEYQSKTVPYFHKFLLQQWIWAHYLILKADKLVIMGYRFPPEDSHIRFILRDIAEKRKNIKLDLEIYSKTKEGSNVVASIIKKLFDVKSCNYMGSVKG